MNGKTPRKLAELIKPGDVILPLEREVRLLMRRAIKDRGLPESALHMTVVDAYEGEPDKRGRWIVMKAKHSAEWNSSHTFTIKARPETPWPVIVA